MLFHINDSFILLQSDFCFRNILEEKNVKRCKSKWAESWCLDGGTFLKIQWVDYLADYKNNKNK